MKRGNKKGRRFIAAFKEGERLEYVGLFLSDKHCADFLGIYNANIGKYLHNNLQSLNGYLVVEFRDEESIPVDSERMKTKAMKLAEMRQKRSKLIHLNNETIFNLPDDKINEINNIIEKHLQEA